MFNKIANAALIVATAVSLRGVPLLISTTGTSPFGFTGQPAFVIGWNQAVNYTNVTITMPLQDNTATPLSGVEGTVYLVNQIGPGTTAANQVAAPVQITGLTGTFSTKTLFSSLNLPAGNYYLVLVPTNTNPMSSSPEGSSSPNFTTSTGPSVTALGSGVPSAPLAGYPPASAVTLNTGNIFFTALGVAGAAPTPIPGTPAPATLILSLTGIACVGLWMARRKFAA